MKTIDYVYRFDPRTGAFDKLKDVDATVARLKRAVDAVL